SGMSSASWVAGAAAGFDGSVCGAARASLGGDAGIGAGATESGSAAAKRSANESDGPDPTKRSAKEGDAPDATVAGRDTTGGDSTITLLSATSGRLRAASGAGRRMTGASKLPLPSAG